MEGSVITGTATAHHLMKMASLSRLSVALRCVGPPVHEPKVFLVKQWIIWPSGCKATAARRLAHISVSTRRRALTSRSAGRRWPGGSWRCWRLRRGLPPRIRSQQPPPWSVWRRWIWTRRSRSLHLQVAAGWWTGASPTAPATLRGSAAAGRGVGNPACSHWAGWTWNCCPRDVVAGSSWWGPDEIDAQGCPNILRLDAALQVGVERDDGMTRLLFHVQMWDQWCLKRNEPSVTDEGQIWMYYYWEGIVTDE